MRNLKRALSLTLASVMLLGMMVVGAGAAGFPDVDEDNANIEAIEVLQAVEVMIGDDNGNFGPNDPVNRSQMAVVMAKLLNLDYQYYEASCPFWDVPTWARPYVGACYANKIVSGYGDGTYGAADGVTPVQAASMMMRALGYFQHSEDYQGGFETATVRQGTQIGIFDGVGSSANAEMTRSQVARMALNALESTMVTFTGTPGVTVGDATIGYRAEYTERTSTELKYRAIEDRSSDVSGDSNHRGQYYIQLGEELYNGKLTKRFDRDEFMRPSINWQFDGKNIGTYVDYELLLTGGTYTDEVKYSALYDLLTYTTIRDNDLDRYVDGVDQNESKDNFNRSNGSKVGGRGVLTEVFYDQGRDEITITSINTYLAKANSDYNNNTETLSLRVYDRVSGTTYTVDSDDVAEVVDVEKDDFMLVYMSGKDNATRMDVVRVFDVEIMADSTVTKFSTDDNKVVSKLTTGGTEYSTNPKAFYDKGEDVLGVYDNQLLTDTSYNIYLDRYGNAIGVDLYEGTKNYVFITGFDRGTSHISTKTADAAAIFLDGTMDVITVNVTDTDKNIDRMNGSTNDEGASGDPYFVQWEKTPEGRVSENRWYTYTVNNNGTYTLRPVANMFASDYAAETVLNTANLYVDDNGVAKWDVDGWKTENADQRISYGYTNKGRAYGEDASIYITVESGHVDMSDGAVKDAITDVKGVYTGIQDVKMEIAAPTATEDQIPNRVYTVYDSDHYIIASILVGDAQGAVANFAYILSGVKSERYEASSSTRANDGVYYWEFDAFYQGEKTTLTARTNYPSRSYDLNRYTIQELRFDGDYVTDVKAVAASKTHTNNTTNEKIEDMDIYDVGRVIGTAWPDGDDFEHVVGSNGDSLNGNGGPSANRLSGTIYLQGRTLYVGNQRNDVGLALARDAKALLVQSENYAGVETREYNSVEEAVSNIADFDTTASGTQFRGRIAAVLDGRGAAEWVVIISDTELTTGNRPSYGDTSDLRWVQYDVSTGTGRYWELYIPGYVDATTVSSETIRNALASNGCSDISRNGSNWNFYRNGTRYENQVVRVVTTYWGDNTISVTGVTLDKATATVKAGETVTLTATVSPSNATNKAVTWTSSDNTVATVSNGVVTGVKAGTATITVTTRDGGYTASCTVTVTAQGTVAVNVPVGRANVLVDGTKVETVAKGQTISLDPAAALTVTSGATNNGDGTYTITGDSITIEAKDATYTWNNFFSQWFHLENGQQVLVPAENRWTVASVAVTSLSRFGLARAAETEDDRKPIDTTDPNWFFDYITDPTKTFEIDVTITRADGTTTTVTFTGSVRNNALTIAPAEGTPEADANAAWSAMGTEGSNTGAFEPAEPVQSDIVTLDATAATTVGTTPNTTKVEDIQSNIKVAYDEATKTFKVTGDLTYQKKLEAYSSNTGKNVGYFVALDLGWAEADRGAYKVQISEIDNGVEKWKNDDLAENNAARTEVILGRVADGTGKMIGNRSIKVTNDFLGTQEIYTIDLSGLKCITPELLKITAVEKEDASTGLGAKKISDIQTGVKVSVDEAAKTVKLTGTLHPVTTAWTDWSSNGNENTGYYAAIYLDASSMTNTTMTIYNPNSVGAAGGKPLTLEGGKDTLIIRVASLSEKLTGAPEAGKDATIIVSNANSAEKMVTYTLDFSGLTLEPRGNGEAKLTAAYGAVGGSFGSVKGSDFQKNLTITKTGDTFYFTGELNPIKWTEFSNDQALTKGYYVFFNIDASDVTGAAAWSVRGNAGGNSPTAKEDFAFFLGNTELKNEDIKSNTLYVLSEAVSGSGVPDAGKTLKTYRLDFSGVTLLEAEPFTVTARSTDVEDANVHQELLCDMDTYKVTVDHKNKKIVVTGDLYAISEVYTPWAYSELKTVMGTKADSEGYFVTFQVDKSSLEESFAFKTEGVDKKNNGTDTTDSSGVIVRVAKTGATENAAGRLLLKTGTNEYETYEFDLTGVTFKATGDRTEPTQPNHG